MSSKNIQLQEHGNIESSLGYFLKFNIVKDAKILDIGCRFGTLIYNLYERGYKNVSGIDIDQDAVIEGKELYGNIAGAIRGYDGFHIPFDEEFFDVVLMFDVIEHIPDVERFLKEEVHRVLKKGGVLIFQTPNKYPNILWQMINQKSLVKWKNSSHCSLRTHSSIKKNLEESGFRNIFIEKYSILTEHNKKKVRKKLGKPGIFLLHIMSGAPLFLYPNLWGMGRK